MPFTLCRATVNFQRSIIKSVVFSIQRVGTICTCYVNDIIIIMAWESTRDYLVRLREDFDCIAAGWFNCASGENDFKKRKAKTPAEPLLQKPGYPMKVL